MRKKTNLDELDANLNQATKNHKSALLAIKKTERELKSAYESKFQALRQLSDDSRDVRRNDIDGGATIQTLEALNRTVKDADRYIERHEADLDQAKQTYLEAETALAAARDEFATAYYEFADQKWQELQTVMSKASEINSELQKYGNTAWKSLHVDPVIGKGRNSDADLTSVMYFGNNALKTLKRKVG